MMFLILGWLSCKSDNGLVSLTDTDPAVDTEVADTDVADTDVVDTDVTDLDADDDGSLDVDDCDDADPTVFPGAPEVCDGRDTDCDPGNEAAACACTTASYGGHTYQLCTVHVDWASARGVCRLLGADLAVVDDPAENTFLVAAGDAVDPAAAWWLGLTDAASEGTWATITGSAPAYDGFCPGEPNNAHGGECSAGSEEDCGVLDWCAGGWNDLPCDCVLSQIGIACEGP